MRLGKKLVCIILTLLLLPACGQRSATTPTWQEQYDLGLRYLNEGNYQESIVAFTAAIEIDPKRAEAYIGLADAYIYRNDYDMAIQTLYEGIESGVDGGLQERLGEILDEIGAVHTFENTTVSGTVTRASDAFSDEFASMKEQYAPADIVDSLLILFDSDTLIWNAGQLVKIQGAKLPIEGRSFVNQRVIIEGHFEKASGSEDIITGPFELDYEPGKIIYNFNPVGPYWFQITNIVGVD